MATTTTNLGLVIPAMGDAPNINVVSQAFEGVDSFAGGVVAGSTDQYDSSATYAIDDLCIYNNTLYKCNTAISTPEAWDSTHWTQSSLANEVGTLTDQIAKVDTRSSLIVGENATTTSTSFSTYSGRKFSDYRLLWFALYTSKTDKSIIRQSALIPRAAWATGKQIMLTQNHGGSLENVSGVTFIYESDTSIRAIATGAGALVGFEVQGYVNI